MKAIVWIKTWNTVENNNIWKRFEVASEKKYIFEAEDLLRAELKVLESFPAEKCIGFSIKMENGDFLMGACKDWYFEDGDVPTDEEIRKYNIERVKRSIKNDDDVKAGRKRWVEDPNSLKGDMILVDVEEVA